MSDVLMMQESTFFIRVTIGTYFSFYFFFTSSIIALFHSVLFVRAFGEMKPQDMAIEILSFFYVSASFFVSSHTLS
jgi:hypothetical protein